MATPAAPRPRRIDPEIPHGLSITWAGAGQSRFGARQLRQACRCAECVEEMTGRQLLDVAAVPQDIELHAVELVGRYGLNLRFSDGHGSGIYTFAQLFALSADAAGGR